MAKNREIIIRVWDLGKDNNISLEDVENAFQDLLTATNLPCTIVNSKILGFETIAIQSKTNNQYMPLYNYLTSESGSLLLVTSVEGKGPQVKADELEKLYYKATGAWSDFKYGLEKGKQAARYFGNSTRAAGIAGGIGAATGLAIRGTFKLAAKGVRALLRDKEAYEAEMAFYTTALGVVDYIAGGVDTADIVKKIEEGATNNNAVAQYLYGNAYAEGRGVDQNLDKAFTWFVKAAENGELRSQNIVSGEYLYSSEKEYSFDEKQKGIAYLYNLAEKGEVWAWSLLIDIYGRGTVSGIDPDYDEAIRIAQIYSDYDPLFSATFLAPILDTSIPAYEESLNSYKNDTLAFKAYQVILDGEDKEACNNAAMRLAFMCKEGRGTTQSNSEAVSYLIKASNYGNQDAKLALIDAYLMGIGVEQSEKTASKYAKELLHIGNPHYIPLAYYALFKIADEKELYKESMKMARSYLACDNTDRTIKEQLSTYLEDLESRISQMTDEERREFLKEPKKITIDPKYFKWIVMAVAAIIAVIGIVSVADNVSRNNDFDDDYYDESVMDEPIQQIYSSEAETAINAYRELLTGDGFNRGNDENPEIWHPDNCKFNVAYIDGDDIPELILCDYEDSDHASGWGQIYSTMDGEIFSYGKLFCPEDENAGDMLGYYEKSAYYADFNMYQGYGDLTIRNPYGGGHIFEKDFFSDNGTETDVTYSIDGEECDESEFYDKISQYTQGAEFIPYSFYDNTQDNRERLLGSDSSDYDIPASNSSLSINSEEEAVQYIKDLTGIEEGASGDFEDIHVGSGGTDNGYYTEGESYIVSVYNDLEDHISTLGRYAVTREGYVYNIINEEWVITEDGQVGDF